MRLKGISVLKKRSDFINAKNKGLRAGSKYLVLQATPENYYNSTALDQPSYVRVGFIVTKKTGNAVIRNKIKRRFRVLSQQVIATNSDNSYYYIIMANYRTAQATFSQLNRDLIYCLKIVNCYIY